MPRFATTFSSTAPCSPHGQKRGASRTARHSKKWWLWFFDGVYYWGFNQKFSFIVSGNHTKGPGLKTDTKPVSAAIPTGNFWRSACQRGIPRCSQLLWAFKGSEGNFLVSPQLDSSSQLILHAGLKQRHETFSPKVSPMAETAFSLLQASRYAMYRSLFAYGRMYVCVCNHVCAYVYIYIYIYVHIFTYMPACCVAGACFQLEVFPAIVNFAPVLQSQAFFALFGGHFWPIFFWKFGRPNSQNGHPRALGMQNREHRRH